MRRLLPDPATDLDDTALAEAYALPAGADRHLRMNFVTSADGAATLDGRSGGLSGSGDKRVFGLLRDLADVILVGAGTVRDEGYGPPGYDAGRRARRRGRGLAEVPPYALVSNSLALDPGRPLFTRAEARTIVVAPAGVPAERRAALAGVADIVTAGTERVDLAGALAQLADRGLRRVLGEGGPTLFSALLAGGHVDELCLTVSPLLTGPGPVRIVAGAPLPTAPYPLRSMHVLTEDGALFLRYAVGKR